MDKALATLGYTPYTLDDSFKQGNATTHPAEWAALLDRKKRYDKEVFADYDCFVGPPAAMLYDTILRECPSYTKVILVEEPDKQRWANEYEERMARVSKALEKTSRNKVSIAFRHMLGRMVVGEDAKTASTGASSSAASPQSSTASPHTSSPADIQRAFAQESKHVSKGEAGRPAAAVAEGGKERITEEEKWSARAKALQKYEENVMISVPPSRLLVYKHGDGWEPLCEFLEKPVPGVPFPPLDNGLIVLGKIEDRIHRAQVLLYMLMSVAVTCCAVTLYPRMGIVTDFVSGMILDYRVAFGTDDDASKPVKKNESDAFEDAWRQRGGVITKRVS